MADKTLTCSDCSMEFAFTEREQAFYAENGRLATEHALIDDNGDRQGTPAEWFRGTRLQRRPQGTTEPDGARASVVALVPTAGERLLTAEQRAQRETLEHELETLDEEAVAADEKKDRSEERYAEAQLALEAAQKELARL